MTARTPGPTMSICVHVAHETHEALGVGMIGAFPAAPESQAGAAGPEGGPVESVHPVVQPALPRARPTLNEENLSEAGLWALPVVAALLGPTDTTLTHALSIGVPGPSGCVNSLVCAERQGSS